MNRTTTLFSNYNSKYFSEGSAILDIHTSTRFWRTSQLLSADIILAEQDHIRETILISEKEADEYDILLEIKSLLSKAGHIYTFNGTAFDIPHLSKKYKAYKVDCPIHEIPHTDLMLSLRKFKPLLPLKSHTLSDYFSLLLTDADVGSSYRRLQNLAHDTHLPHLSGEEEDNTSTKPHNLAHDARPSHRSNTEPDNTITKPQNLAHDARPSHRSNTEPDNTITKPQNLTDARRTYEILRLLSLNDFINGSFTISDAEIKTNSEITTDRVTETDGKFKTDGEITADKVIKTDGEITTDKVAKTDGEIKTYGETLRIRLSCTLPCEIQGATDYFSIKGYGSEAEVTARIINGNLRLYYPDFQNYMYLPLEGYAVHKSVASYIAASRKVPADKETCFTYIPLNHDFLKNPLKMMKYLTSLLKYLIS